MSPRLIKAGVAIAIACYLLAWTAILVSLAWGADDATELAAVTRKNCQQVEEVKKELRSQAFQAYARLEQTARVYGFTVTPEIRAAALVRRDRTLARFAAGEC